MKAAILLCDQVMDKLQPQFGTYQTMIERMFAAAGTSISFDAFDCRKGEYPESNSGYDFFITTGSKSSVYDPEPWIAVLLDFVKKLHEKKNKLIGICFGHQLIAMALGCSVKQSPKGWGVGVSENRVISHPPWMKEQPDQFNVLVSHRDQVMELPEDAKVIAESNFCPYFIIQWNNHFLSVQGHPEWPKGYSEALMNLRRGTLIPEERVARGLDSLQLDVHNVLFVRWVMAFLGECS